MSTPEPLTAASPQAPPGAELRDQPSALDVIRSRRSISRLGPPAPSPADLATMLEAAACAPDHGSLRPWRFVILDGEAKDRFGPVLADATVRWERDGGREPDPRKVDKDRTKMDRAPLVVVVACEEQPNPKVPRHEQVAAAVAAAQNLCLAATALGYGSMWRTGPNAENPHVKVSLGLRPDDKIVAFVYLGTVSDEQAKPANAPSLDGLVRRWFPPER
ncbi:MAG: nitroreductase [Actinobacteria bacterium]|nr:nitroreductase [Actinomycetota bacterium]